MNLSEPPGSAPRHAPQAAPAATAAAASSAALPSPTTPGLMRTARRDVAAVGATVLLPALTLAWALGASAAYVGLALLWFAAGAALVLRGLRSGLHPHAHFGSANLITTLRLALGALLAGLLAEAAWAPPLAAATTAPLAWGAVGLATFTAVLDACDGPLARRSGLASAFGARFDMETDAALTLVLCALVWQAGQAGPWVLAAGLMRYAFVAAAAGWPWLNAPLAPSRRRQTVCVVQITALIVCLGPAVPPAVAHTLAAATLALLSLSFAIDIRTLARSRHCPPEP